MHLSIHVTVIDILCSGLMPRIGLVLCSELVCESTENVCLTSDLRLVWEGASGSI